MAVKTKYREFVDARDFVRKLGLKSVQEWRKFAKSGKKPDDIPWSPHLVYKEWKSYVDWLGSDPRKSRYKTFLSFTEARKIVQKLGLKNESEWRKFTKTKKMPINIPSRPETTYQKEWEGMANWLGRTVEGSSYGRYRNFEDAKKFIHPLKLFGSQGWQEYCTSGKKPSDIPSKPQLVYKEKWISWVDWTGIDARKTKSYKKFLPFIKARDFVRKLGLKSVSEWNEYKKSGKKPRNIPASPNLVYKEHWKDYGDWLGTERIASQKIKYRTFVEAKKFVHNLKLKKYFEWREFAKTNKKPIDIPANPMKVYKNEWKSTGDWLGTKTIAHQKKKFLPFNDAKEYVRSLGLKSYQEWLDYSQSVKRPVNIPSHPYRFYEKDWIDFHDWIGIEDPAWSSKKVKELLRDLIKSGIIYQWDEAVLYSFLNRKGLLNISNRHSKFFKSLLSAIKYPEGKEAVEEYAYADIDVPPDITKFQSSISDLEKNEEEIDEANSEELAELVQDSEPLEYGELQPVENILRHTDFLESINADEEAMRFYVNYSLNQLWKNAFAKETETISKLKQEGKNGNKYHDKVIETFLFDYVNAKNLEIPPSYSFPKDPVLMQYYVAYKIKTNPYYANFSGTGAGKTLSAILASRVIDSKLTLIVCPNDVVDQWERHIAEIFPDSVIVSGKDAFYVKPVRTKHTYAILNYDKFNQLESPNLILNLVNEKIDFVVLDEIHFSKIRDKNVTIRRQNVEGLMTAIRKKNNKAKVLGVSATPVVNNLQEGRSLLELVSGKIFDDVATRPTIPNAVTLYEKLSNMSIREIPNYPISVNTNVVDVETQLPPNVTVKHLKSNPLTIEQVLTDARIPEIIRLIDGQTIIYTEYVENIIQKISEAVRNSGYSFALYTGQDRSGLKRFLEKRIQVLIASRPISTGIDGLQKICNRLIINTLPWTNAQYQQLLGRLVRRGQIEDIVNVYIVKASISGYPYDQLKLDRIKFKKTLADCAVDGILPERNLITPGQAAAEAVRWLERLERDEISTVTRRDLDVNLTPVEIERREKKYGDFEKLNNQINIEKSETTHLRLLKNPEEWIEYHRQYREARKTWNVIPYEEWIKRLKDLSPRLEIGDFGCGEARMLEEVGDRVHSFDHLAINSNVTPCDIRSVPLEEGSLDVVIFSLSLMGKNWQDYISEARRCLASNGYLFISETTNSLKGRLETLREKLKEQGFEIYDDYELGLFTFIEARKT